MHKSQGRPLDPPFPIRSRTLEQRRRKRERKQKRLSRNPWKNASQREGRRNSAPPAAGESFPSRAIFRRAAITHTYRRLCRHLFSVRRSLSPSVFPLSFPFSSDLPPPRSFLFLLLTFFFIFSFSFFFFTTFPFLARSHRTHCRCPWISLSCVGVLRVGDGLKGGLPWVSVGGRGSSRAGLG